MTGARAHRALSMMMTRTPRLTALDDTRWDSGDWQHNKRKQRGPYREPPLFGRTLCRCLALPCRSRCSRYCRHFPGPVVNIDTTRRRRQVVLEPSSSFRSSPCNLRRSQIRRLAAHYSCRASYRPKCNRVCRKSSQQNRDLSLIRPCAISFPSDS